MDQSLEVTVIKNEPTDSTSSDRLEIPTEMQINPVKRKSNYLVYCEYDIKTETQKDDSVFPVISSTSYETCQDDEYANSENEITQDPLDICSEMKGTSYKLCPNYDIKFEIEEPLIKIKCEDLVHEIMKDPLDVGSEIKVEEQFSSDLDQDESRIKREPIEGQTDEHLLETDRDNLHGSGSNQNQDQLLIRNDSDRKYKKYVCNKCKKAFREKCNLNRHLRIHTGEKPFTCDICEKSFNRKGHLDTHMLIHSDKKPHSCDVCKKFFRHKPHLNVHKLIHSGTKPFSCNVCDGSFTQKHSLVRHKRTHTGEKPFVCDICKKAFARKIQLTLHKHVHTGEKTFSGDACNKSFTQTSHLNKHKKTHKNYYLPLYFVTS